MGLNTILLDYLRTLITLTMLAYASYKDVKTREVHDLVWIIPSTIGVLLDLYELFTNNLNVIEALINIGFIIVLSGVLYFLNLFGEADLLAFIALSIIHPRVPMYNFIGYPPIIFSFTLIANSAMTGVLMTLVTAGTNMMLVIKGIELFNRHESTSLLKKIALFFSGRYIKVDSLRGPPFEYPLEDNEKLMIKPNLSNDDEANLIFKSLRENNFERVWVSTTIPYIVVLLVGYLISVIFGDLMFTILVTLGHNS